MSRHHGDGLGPDWLDCLNAVREMEKALPIKLQMGLYPTTSHGQTWSLVIVAEFIPSGPVSRLRYALSKRRTFASETVLLQLSAQGCVNSVYRALIEFSVGIDAWLEQEEFNVPVGL